MFLLATAGLLRRSDPTEGRPNELAFQMMALLPFFPVLMWLFTINGLKEGSALKSPTASIDDTAMFPGSTGSQSSQIQNGVKPCPDFANMLNVVCHPRSACQPALRRNGQSCGSVRWVDRKAHRR